MENLVLSGVRVGFQPLITHSSVLFSSTNSSTTTNTNKYSRSITSTDTYVKQPDKKYSNNSSASASTFQKPIKSFYSSRQAAILDVQSAADLDSALARYEEVLQVNDLNVVLRYFGKLNRWRDVSKIFDWMMKHEKINVTSYSSFIKFMGKGFNPVKALEVYNSIQNESMRTNVSVCNAVLGCLVRNGKFESSIKLFGQMKEDGLTPDAVTYSTVAQKTKMATLKHNSLFRN